MVGVLTALIWSIDKPDASSGLNDGAAPANVQKLKAGGFGVADYECWLSTAEAVRQAARLRLHFLEGRPVG